MRHSCRNCRLLALIALFVTVTPMAGQEFRLATLDAEDLRAQILECERRVQSMHVEYVVEYAAQVDIPPSYLHRVIAAQRPSQLFHESAHGHDGLPWQDDPLKRRTIVHGNQWVTDDPLSRCYYQGTLSDTSPLPGSMPYEFYFLATGLWVCDGRPTPRPEGRAVMLQDVAVSPEYSTVLPELESVNGRWCHVLVNPSRDKLWLDVQRGCALLVREFYERETGRILQRFELSNHREVAPTIWLPQQIRDMQFEYSSTTDSEATIDSKLSVVNSQVNQYYDHIFHYTARPGSLLLSADTDPRQTHDGGIDHLDNVAAWIRNYAMEESQLSMNHDLPFEWQAIAIQGIIVILSGEAGLVLFRKFSRHTQRFPE